MGILDDLPTPEQMYAARAGKPISKGSTRLQDTVNERKLTTITAKDFKLAVWKRDKNHCRCCGRKVQKILDRVPERGEVHHCHGRTGDLRFEDKCALLLCLTCHERVTGKVNDKLVVVPTRFIEIRGEKYTDARAVVTFREMR